MIIVVGTFEVAPEDRDAFVASKREVMVRTRKETGNIDYAYSADAAAPGRVRLIERWETMRDLQVHVEALQAATPPEEARIPIVSADVSVYEASPAPVPWG
jgi:quinol monooxygenase YgiN